MAEKSPPKEKWIKLAKGIRCREHPKDTNGIKKDRYFVIRYTLNGKKVQEALGWGSEGMTLDKAQKALSDIKENIRLGNGPRSLAEKREAADELREKAEAEKLQAQLAAISFAKFWKETYLPEAEQSKMPSTIKTEKHLYKNWLGPALGKLPLQKLSVQHIENLKTEALKAGKSAATVRYILAVVSQVWNRAHAHGIVQGENPARRVKKPRHDNRRLKFLAKEEADSLLKALKLRSQDTHDSALLSLFCGLRAGEIHALTWGDINFADSTISIMDPKNKKNRHAFMQEEVKVMLRERWRGQVKTDLVFPATGGGQRQEVSDTFARVVDELGLNDTGEFTTDADGNKVPVRFTDARKKVVFHTLRHTFASWLVQGGTPLYNLMELMGHSSMTMVAGYAHLSPKETRSDAMSLQGILSQVTPEQQNGSDNASDEGTQAE